MSDVLKFCPEFRVLGDYAPRARLEEIAREPRLVGVHGRAAIEASVGPLGRRILDAFGEEVWEVPDGLHLVADSRAQRLMPGQYPAIPGWHCDDWPRPSYEAQPDPEMRDRRARHFTGFVSTRADVSRTEYLCRSIEVPRPIERSLWSYVHAHVAAARYPSVLQPEGKALRFSGDTLHRATPTQNRGWRYWLRLSWMHRAPDKVLTVGPEQVYVLSEENGW